MKKLANQQHDVDTAEFVVGHDRFAQISAVEGIELSTSMKTRLVEADRAGLSDEQKREAIIAVHRKA
jgi:hypothetical protein